MAKAVLHELLAAEKTRVSATTLLLDETRNKFAKVDSYFKGHIKSLKMLEDNLANKTAEAAAREDKPLPTTVADTIGYVLSHWAQTEDLLFQKNASNQRAVATIELGGKVLASNVPVDELMGLENRLVELRKLIQIAPTLDASMKWARDANLGEHVWVTVDDEDTVKTEKQNYAVTLAPATEKHPAQVKEASKDVIVGKFSIKRFSGALTTVQKADALTLIDELVAEVKKSRIRANQVEASTDKIGLVLTDLIMAQLTKK